MTKTPEKEQSSSAWFKITYNIVTNTFYTMYIYLYLYINFYLCIYKVYVYIYVDYGTEQIHKLVYHMSYLFKTIK